MYVRLLRRLFHGKVFWGVSSRMLNIAGGFILLPIIIHTLNSEQLSLYYLFISLSMISGILDLGFNAVITRNLAYAYVGADDIQSEGVHNEFSGKANWVLIKDLFVTARKLYLYLSIVVIVILLVPGSFYIAYVLSSSDISIIYGVSCWIIYAFASAIAMYYMYLSTVVQARGDVTLSNQIALIARIIYIIVCIILLKLNLGLLALSISMLLVGIVERVLYYKIIYRDDEHKQLKNIKQTTLHPVRVYLKKLSGNASKNAVTAIGAYLVMKATTFVSVSYLGLAASASYILTIQVVNIMVVLSNTIFVVYVPEMTHLVRRHEEQIVIFGKANLLSMSIYVFGATFIIFFSHSLLLLMHAKTALIDNKQLILLFAVYLLEIQHSNFATLIGVSNRVPFVKSAIYSGISIVVLSIVLVKYCSLGLWGVIVGQGLVQLVYNNWYWVYFVCKEYKVTFFKIYKLGFYSVCNILKASR